MIWEQTVPASSRPSWRVSTSILAVLAFFAATPAGAASLAWLGKTNNDWSNSGNWSAARLPSSADSVTIDRPEQIWLGAKPGAAGSLVLGLSSTANLFVATSLTTGAATLGSQAGSSGHAVLSGSSAILQSGGLVTVGSGGAGELDLYKAARFSGADLSLGAQKTGNGLFIATEQAQLALGGALTVGDAGRGTFDLYTGARATAGSAVFGNASGSTGTLAIAGGGSALAVANALTLGKSGKGALDLSTGASLQAKGLTLGALSGGDGSANVSGGGTLLSVSGGTVIGDQGNGSFGLYTGAGLTTGTLDVGSRAAGTGSLIAGGGGTSVQIGGAVTIGSAGRGSLVLQDGAVARSGRLTLGGTAGSSGVLLISGNGSSYASTDRVNVGSAGTGQLTLTGGGALSATGLTIATSAGSSGTVTIGAAHGAIARGAGMLTTPTIQFGSGTGALVFNIGGPDYTLASVLSGAGTIHADAGSVILTGNSSGFSGRTLLSGGRLAVNGTLGGTVALSGYGTLAGTGTVGSTTVGKGGTIAPAGDAAGTLTIKGDLTFQAGSHYQATVNPGSNVADRIAVSGKTAINAGSSLDVVQASAINLARQDRILDSTGGITGSFDTITSNYSFVTPSLVNDGHGLTLKLARNATPLASAAKTSGGAAAAVVIDQLSPASALYQQVLPLSASQAASTLDDLSGSIHASSGVLGFDVSRFGQMAGIDRLGSMGASGGLFQQSPSLPLAGSGPSGLLTAYAGEGKSADPAAFAAILADPANAGVTGWGRAYGGWSSRTGENGDRIATTGGLLLGADAGFGDSWRFGLLAGIGRSAFHEGVRDARGSSDDYSLGLYGGHTAGPLSLRFGAQYALQEVETTRKARFNGFDETLDGHYRGGATGLFAELGYAARAGDVDLEPFADISVIHQTTDGFTETGGNSALTVGASDTWLPTTILGLRAGRQFELGAFRARLRGMLGWQHAFDEEGQAPTFAFEGSRDFSTAGTSLGTDSALVELGFDVATTDATSLGLTYDGAFDGQQQSHMLKLNFASRF